MTLLSELRQHQVSWQVDRVDVPSTRNPANLIGHVRVQLFDNGGAKPQTHELLLQGYLASDSLERLLASALRKHLPKHPAYRAWLDSKGNVPVKMSDESIECVGEALHTAMRKLADSPESAIQWNAVHHLARDDWSALLEATRVALREHQKTAKRLLRRDIGLLLKEVWTEKSEELRYSVPQAEDKRTDLQKFALLALHLACKSTDDDEWVWSWTGYLCEDADADQSKGEQAEPAAA